MEAHRLKGVDSIVKNLKEMEIRRKRLARSIDLKNKEKANKFRETYQNNCDRKASLK